MKRAAAALIAVTLAHAGAPAFAANPRLSEDFRSIMGWLSSEASEGMAFHSATSFDPPVELRAWSLGFDYNFGIGTIPMQKNSFPTLNVKTLQDLKPEENFLNTTPFPDMTAHLRLGLPDRWEAAFRLSDMTVPKHKISPTTEGEGQSNILGGQVRKHLGDPRLERVTLYATYDYMFGGFKFFNEFQDIPVTDDLFLDSKNEGLLAWSMKTLGVGFTVSHDWGRWVPYYGFGYHYSSGSIHTRLISRFNTPVVAPIVGEGEHRVRGNEQMRATLGTMKHGKTVSWYAATEVLVLGSRAGRAFSIHGGFSVPIRTPWKQRSYPTDLRDAPAPLDEDADLPSTLIILR